VPGQRGGLGLGLCPHLETHEVGLSDTINVECFKFLERCFIMQVYFTNQPLSVLQLPTIWKFPNLRFHVSIKTKPMVDRELFKGSFNLSKMHKINQRVDMLGCSCTALIWADEGLKIKWSYLWWGRHPSDLMS